MDGFIVGMTVGIFVGLVGGVGMTAYLFYAAFGPLED